MRKKNKNKLIDALMGFYSVLTQVYHDSARFEDPALANLIVMEHLNFLVGFHKAKMEKEGMKPPELKEFYKKYIDEWNAFIISKEQHLKGVVEGFFNMKKNKKKKEYDYII